MEGQRRGLSSVCQCGATKFETVGAPIALATCHCASCSSAGRQFEQASGAPRVLRSDGGVDYNLFRKDRVKLVRGADNLVEHRLTPGAPTRRVVATCCNSPMFADFAPGHWLSLYGGTMVDTVQSTRLRTHTARFFLTLLGSWVAVGFRRPKAGF